MDQNCKKLPHLRFRGEAPAMHYKKILTFTFHSKSRKTVVLLPDIVNLVTELWLYDPFNTIIYS